MKLSRKAAPILGMATLAALGLAAMQPAMAATDTVTSIGSAQQAPPKVGWLADMQSTASAPNNSSGTVSIVTSPAGYSAGSPEANGSLQLGHPDSSSYAGAYNYLGTGSTVKASTLTSQTLSFDAYLDAAAVGHMPDFHIYLLNPSVNGGDTFQTQLIWNAATVIPAQQANTWQTYDLSTGTWTAKIDGTPQSGSNTLAYWLSQTDASTGQTLGDDDIYAFGLVAPSGVNYAGNIYLDNFKVGGQTTDFATPEPSSYAAFAFMGLGAMGLMLKARKRKGLTA